MSKHDLDEIVDRRNRGIAYDPDEWHEVAENGLGPKEFDPVVNEGYDENELSVEAGTDVRLEEAHAALADMVREGASLDDKITLYSEVLEDALAIPPEQLTYEDLVFIDEIQIEKARMILESNPVEFRKLNRIIKRKTSETNENLLVVLENLKIKRPKDISDEVVEAALELELAQAKLAEDLLCAGEDQPVVAPREYNDYSAPAEEDKAA